MLDKMWPTVNILPGVRKLVHHLKTHNIPIAVATSSRRHKYELKITNLWDVFGQFEGKVVCSDDKQFNMRGKPNPDIFITAAREMLGRNVGHPEEECTTDHLQERAQGLVFEDSLPGVQAGKRADMSGSFVFLGGRKSNVHESNSYMGAGPKSSQCRIFRDGKTGPDAQESGGLRPRGVGFAALCRVARCLAKSLNANILSIGSFQLEFKVNAGVSHSHSRTSETRIFKGRGTHSREFILEASCSETEANPTTPYAAWDTEKRL